MSKSPSNDPMLKSMQCKKWSMLSAFEKKYLEEQGIVNGCGGQRLGFLIPEFHFKACCLQHDYNYWLGGKESDRAKADWQFFVAMLADAEKLQSWRAWLHIGLSITYYLAVRVFGFGCFEYRR